MFNILKTLKENKRLVKENEMLKGQVEALTEFRKSFENYYNDMSACRTIVKTHNDIVDVKGAFVFDMNSLYYPVEHCKREVVKRLCEDLIPLIDFTVLDNRALGTKELVGSLSVVKKG